MCSTYKSFLAPDSLVTMQPDFFFFFLSTISLLVNIIESLHSWDPDSAVQTEVVLRFIEESFKSLIGAEIGALWFQNIQSHSPCLYFYHVSLSQVDSCYWKRKATYILFNSNKKAPSPQ